MKYVRKSKTLLLALPIVFAISIAPAAFSYGNTAQWEIGFSGTCNVASVCASMFGTPPGFTVGFWGWCTFGGSNGSPAPGTTGISGDCQITTYANPPGTQARNPYHISQDVTSWVIATGSAFNPPGVPSFFINGGTLEFTGPGSPAPTRLTIPLSAVCDLSNFPTSVLGNPACDTGIPSNPGHYSLHPVPGVELNIQVNEH